MEEVVFREVWRGVEKELFKWGRGYFRYLFRSLVIFKFLFLFYKWLL